MLQLSGRNIVQCDGASRSRWQLGLAAGSTAGSCLCIFTLAPGTSTGPSGLPRTCWRTAILTPDQCSCILSPLVMPGWPWLWAGHFYLCYRFVPLLIVPGPLLALALLRYRDRDALLLLLAALMPQRWFYDTFILWLIPKTRREIIWTIFFS